jgi:hypothetical protein
MEGMMDDRGDLVMALTRKLGEALTGNPPAIQGAALADALSLWLAGHQLGDDERNQAYRAKLLEHHIELVKKLMPVSDEIVKEMLANGAIPQQYPSKH